LDQKTFNEIRRIVYDKSGISISERKVALVSARVRKRMRALDISAYNEYLKHLKQDKTKNELVKLLDVISTNVTHFFRESEHFDFLAQVIKEWLSLDQKKFRFWSAACSTGEEPYTMAITILEALEEKKVDLKILATDLSTNVLAQAINGVYPEKKVETIPPAHLRKYFINSPHNEQVQYRAKDNLKKLILFRRLNLSEAPFPMKNFLDIIFCRNVMIYFDTYHRKKLINELYRLIRPGGYLIVGHSESITGFQSNFKVVRPSIYIKE